MTIASSGTWTLGVLIWIPVLVITATLLIPAGVWLWKYDERVDPGYRGFSKAGAITCWVTALTIVVVSLFGFYPYKSEYHQWREVGGTVKTIDSRLIGTSGTTESKFVVRFNDSPQQYGCEDTRCASVRAGDELVLSCKREWQYTGTDGYDCRFVSTKAA